MEPVLILGAGELASGAAWRLARAGFPVVMTELARPLCVRRRVCFASAIWEGSVEIEGVRDVEVRVDPEAASLRERRWHVVVDGRMAKRNLGVSRSDGRLVIGLGPGFCAGRDVHYVIETRRGPTLGAVIKQGEALPDSGVPDAVEGVTEGRVVRAPVAGTFRSGLPLGRRVRAGDRLGEVDGTEVIASTDGILRGLIHDGVEVTPGMKIGDVYPRLGIDIGKISDKARAVGESVEKGVRNLFAFEERSP